MPCGWRLQPILHAHCSGRRRRPGRLSRQAAPEASAGPEALRHPAPTPALAGVPRHRGCAPVYHSLASGRAVGWAKWAEEDFREMVRAAAPRALLRKGERALASCKDAPPKGARPESMDGGCRGVVSDERGRLREWGLDCDLHQRVHTTLGGLEGPGFFEPATKACHPARHPGTAGTERAKPPVGSHQLLHVPAMRSNG